MPGVVVVGFSGDRQEVKEVLSKVDVVMGYG